MSGLPSAHEAFMSFMLLIAAGIGLVVMIGVIVAVVIAATSSRGRDDER
jgi:hypothetical protein